MSKIPLSFSLSARLWIRPLILADLLLLMDNKCFLRLPDSLGSAKDRQKTRPGEKGWGWNVIFRTMVSGKCHFEQIEVTACLVVHKQAQR